MTTFALRRDATGFTSEDFRHTANLLRTYGDAVRAATASNNHNIILAALDLAAHAFDENQINASETPNALDLAAALENIGLDRLSVAELRYLTDAAAMLRRCVDAAIESAINARKPTTCATAGHDWEFVGARNAACGDGCACSVPVHHCKRCGDCDYGDNDEARDVVAACAERAQRRLGNLADALVEDLLATPDEEVIAEEEGRKE